MKARNWSVRVLICRACCWVRARRSVSSELSGVDRKGLVEDCAWVTRATVAVTSIILSANSVSSSTGVLSPAEATIICAFAGNRLTKSCFRMSG